MIAADYINDTICDATDKGREQDALLAAVLRGKIALTYNPDIDALQMHRELPKLMDWYEMFQQQEEFSKIQRICQLQPSSYELVS